MTELSWRSGIFLLASASCSLVEERRIQMPHDPPSEGAPLAWDAEAAEVWSWDVELHGRSADGAMLTRCELEQGTRHAALSVYGPAFTAPVRLASGDNVIGAWCEDVTGARHRAPPLHLVGRLRDAPVARIVSSAGFAGALVLEGSASESSERDRTPLASTTWLDEAGAVLGTERRISVTLPAAAAPPKRVRLVVRDAKGRTDETWVAVGPHGVLQRPHWTDDAIVYGITPSRFGAAPSLRAATSALPSIAELGANTVSLAPVFAIAPSTGGDAIVDHGRVRVDYGTEDDLVAFVGEAHRLGMRVLLDWVPSHTSDQHPWFREAERFGAAARTFRFYARDEHGAATHSSGAVALFDLDYGTAEVERAMTEQATGWLRRAHVDGFRVDAAWAIKERAPSYFDRFVAEVHRVAPDAMLLADASARDPYYLAHGFDATYDRTGEGRAAWEHVFDDPNDTPDRLEAALVAAARGGDARREVRFLTDRDADTRFVSRHGTARARVATAAILTMPGIPSLPDDEELRAWVRRLVALRHERPSLRSGTWRRVVVTTAERSPARATFAAWRTDPSTRESTLVVLHFGEREATVTIPVKAPKLRDLIGGGAHATNGGMLRLKLAPSSALILAGDDESIARAD